MVTAFVVQRLSKSNAEESEEKKNYTQKYENVDMID